MGRLKRFMVLLGFMAIAPSALAQWPERGVEILVPFPAGGINDVVARIFGDQLSPRIKQPVIVTNRVGAAGVVGTGIVAENTDGYRIGMISNGPMTLQPLLRRDSSYTLESFTPVCQLFSFTYVIAVRPDSPYKTIADLVQATRKKPDSISLAYGGAGSTSHFAVLHFQQLTDTKYLTVPFNGDPPVVLALAGGQVEAALITVDVARPHNFKWLGVSSDRRHPSLPDVPTLREQGIDLVAKSQTGIVVSAKAPPDVAKVLDGECNAIVQSEGFQMAMKRANVLIDFLDRPKYTESLQDDAKVKARLVKISGMKLE